jgi:hypothetical protein
MGLALRSSPQPAAVARIRDRFNAGVEAELLWLRRSPSVLKPGGVLPNSGDLGHSVLSVRTLEDSGDDRWWSSPPSLS